MYEWRKMSPSQWPETLRIRRQNGRSWHSPPHLDLEGDCICFVAAACHEHKPMLSAATDRMKEFESNYIHHNPVKHGLVDHWQNWLLSSA